MDGISEKERTFEIVWEIENFDACPLIYKGSMTSPWFKLESDGLVCGNFAILMHLELPKRKRIVFSVVNREKCLNEIKNWSVRIVDAAGATRLCGGQTKDAQSQSLKLTVNELLNGKSRLLLNRKLKLKCALSVVCDPRGNAQGVMSLCEDLKTLYESGDYHDLIISVRGTDFKTHRFVLMARAPKFWGQLEVGTADGLSFTSTVRDMRPRTMHALLVYFYGGNAELCSDEDLTDLLDFAEKHDLDDLKNRLSFSASPHCRTRVAVIRKTIDWRMKDFCRIFVEDGYRHSCFVTLRSLKLIVSMKKEIDSKAEMNIRLVVRSIHETELKPMYVTCRISVFTVENKMYKRKVEAKHYADNFDEEWVLPPFLSKKRMRSLRRSSDSILRLKLDFAVASEEVTHDFQYCRISAASRSVTNIESLFQCNKDFEKLYENRRNVLSDVTIKLDGQSIIAHAGILSVRSDVFRRILRSADDSTEQRSEHLSDLKQEIWELLLKFLYTGILHDIDFAELVDLYAAAQKYEVCSLVSNCSKRLASDVTLSNVCELLQLASEHKDMHLLHTSQSFVAEKWAAVRASENWKALSISDPSLAYDTLLKIHEGSIS